MKLIWYPASGGAPVEFGTYPYKWRDEQGLSYVPTHPVATRGPGQPGETLLNTRLDGRSLNVTVMVTGIDRTEFLEARSNLARALSALPAEHGHRPHMGLLRFERDGLPTLELSCIPVASPSITHRGHNIAEADIEFFAPQPYWQGTRQTSFHISQSDEGFEWPIDGLEFVDIEFPLVSVEIELHNDSHIPTPITVRVFGVVTDPSVANLTTGEAIGINGTVPDDYMLEISTDFGQKTIELVSLVTGQRTDAFYMLNINNADFWWMRPGLNRVRMNYSEILEGGRVQLLYRTRYAGA